MSTKKATNVDANEDSAADAVPPSAPARKRSVKKAPKQPAASEVVSATIPAEEEAGGSEEVQVSNKAYTDMTSAELKTYIDLGISTQKKNLGAMEKAVKALFLAAKGNSKASMTRAVEEASKKKKSSNKRPAPKSTEEEGGASEEPAKKKKNVGGIVRMSAAMAEYLGIDDPDTPRNRSDVTSLLNAKAKEEGEYALKVDDAGNVIEENGQPVLNRRCFRHDSRLGMFFGGPEALKQKITNPKKELTHFVMSQLLKDHLFAISANKTTTTVNAE